MDEKAERPPSDPQHDDEPNEIGYRNVDEEGEYDEAPGRQGDAPPDEDEQR
jgi:hypothetical protein